jgi:hypothetical protein
VRELAGAMRSERWKTQASKDTSLKLSNAPEGLLIEFDKGQSPQRDFSCSISLLAGERPAPGEGALVLPLEVQEGKAELSVEFAEEGGPSFPVRYPKTGAAISLGQALTPAWSADPERAVNPAKIGAVRLRVNEIKTTSVRLLIKRFGWASY